MVNEALEWTPPKRIKDEMRRANQRAARVAAERTIRLLPLLTLDAIVWTIALWQLTTI